MLEKEIEYFKSILPLSDAKAREDYKQELLDNFRTADSDGDGIVTEAEFEILISGFVKFISPVKNSKRVIEKYFKEMDIDGNEEIQFSEFLTFADHVNESIVMKELEKELALRKSSE